MFETHKSTDAVYAELVEPHRPELHAHCHRMLGSFDDAEDALQEALLKAWRGLPKFEGRSSLRSWLYKIGTNTSLDAIERRRRGIVPIDSGSVLDPLEGHEIEDDDAAPASRYEQRESIELAMIAALELLSPRQRVVLVLREALGFSAREVAEALDTSVASVNSALQRARQTIDRKVPERDTLESLPLLDDARVRATAARAADAWERDEVDAVVSTLAETDRVDSGAVAATGPSPEQGCGD